MTDPASHPVRFSTLKHIARSPAHYFHALSAPRTDSPAMRVGRVVHAALLGQAPGERPIVAYDGDRRGKAWQDFAAANASADIVTADEWARGQRIAASVRAEPHAMRLLEGDREIGIAWRHAGRDCSSRLDVLGDGWIADLKTCADASVMGFQRVAWRYHYAAQLAFYADAAASIGRPVSDAYLIAVESAPPHPVTVHRLTPRALEEGRRLYRAWFERLLVCESSRDWPGYALASVEMDVPSWMDVDDDDTDEEV